MPLPPLPVSDLDAVLRLTAPMWEEMRGERLLLTGGTGFFGCWLVESFLHINRALDLKASISVLTRDGKRFLTKLPHLCEEAALSLLEGDVRTFTADQHHAFVVHAATAASARQAANEPVEMLSTILDGTANVLRFATAIGVRKLLFTSSGAVYGKQPAECKGIPETWLGAPDPLLLTSVYGEGKRAAELMCALAATEQLQIKIARCFAFTGPHLPTDQHFAAGSFLGDALAGRPIRVVSDGRSVRSYLYASDLAVWLWTILFRAPSMHAFNVGSAEPTSIQALAAAAAVTVSPAVPVQFASAPSLASVYVPDIARAEIELGLRQTVGLADGLSRTMAWLRLSSCAY